MGFERKQFTFYRSFLAIVEQLPVKKQRDFLLTLIRYALNETEPTTKDSGVKAAFEGIRPVLDKARSKAQTGKIGGSASPGSGKANVSKQQANASEFKRMEANQKRTEAEGEKEKEKEIDIEFDIEGGERDGATDVRLPPAETEDLAKVFEVLRIFDVAMGDKERADCRTLCAQYGTQAVIEAAKTADHRHVPRWSYVRAIVTSGGVGPRGGRNKGGFIRHGDPPTPAMLAAARQMLEEPDDPEFSESYSQCEPGREETGEADSLLRSE